MTQRHDATAYSCDSLHIWQGSTLIAQCWWGDGEDAQKQSDCLDYASAQKRMEHICTALNAHDALVAALKALKHQCEYLGAPSDHEDMQAATDALRLAGVKP